MSSHHSKSFSWEARIEGVRYPNSGCVAVFNLDDGGEIEIRVSELPADEDWIEERCGAHVKIKGAMSIEEL